MWTAMEIRRRSQTLTIRASVGLAVGERERSGGRNGAVSEMEPVAERREPTARWKRWRLPSYDSARDERARSEAERAWSDGWRGRPESREAERSARWSGRKPARQTPTVEEACPAQEVVIRRVLLALHRKPGTGGKQRCKESDKVD